MLNFLKKMFYKVDEELFEQLEENLILADCSAPTAIALVDELRAFAKQNNIQDGEQIKEHLKSQIINLLTNGTVFPPSVGDAVSGVPLNGTISHPTVGDDAHIVPSSKPNIHSVGADIIRPHFEAQHSNSSKPNIHLTPNPYHLTPILIIGVNGVGKTTTIGKLARYFQKQGKSVLLSAADTFRAAATEQLEIWAERANVPIVKAEQGADPSAVVFDSIKSAISRNIDVVLIDTAGRLHNKKDLMDELSKIRRTIDKAANDANTPQFPSAEGCPEGAGWLANGVPVGEGLAPPTNGMDFPPTVGDAVSGVPSSKSLHSFVGDDAHIVPHIEGNDPNRRGEPCSPATSQPDIHLTPNPYPLTSTLLVLDASMGQNALAQAKAFGEISQIDGLILTKLDSTAKGGVVISIAHEQKIPVRFIGTGETIDDLREFNPHWFVNEIFD